MASYFKQLSDDMEKVVQVVSEGYQFMMGETSSIGNGNDENPSDNNGNAMFEGMDGLDDEEESFGSPLMGMADSVMSDIMSTQVGPQTTKEHIQAFTAAITWKEPFIQSLLAFHVLIIIAAVYLCRKGKGIYIRMGFMVFVGIIVRLAEYLNSLGNQRWREFATQNYFDKGGIFMGIMVCAPLLVVVLVMLIVLVREASNLLGDVTQMKQKAKNKQQDKKEGKEQNQSKKRDERKRRKKD